MLRSCGAATRTQRGRTAHARWPACPPEDCGGIWGYSDLLEILADPAHKEHEDRLEWLGLSSAAGFDPGAFDLDQINSGLRGRSVDATRPVDVVAMAKEVRGHFGT